MAMLKGTSGEALLNGQLVDVETGLATITAATATIKTRPRPARGPATVTVEHGTRTLPAGTLRVRVWRQAVTGSVGVDTADDSNDTVSWIAVGN